MANTRTGRGRGWRKKVKWERSVLEDGTVRYEYGPYPVIYKVAQGYVLFRRGATHEYVGAYRFLYEAKEAAHSY